MTDTPTITNQPRIIASSNIGGGETGSYALVALVENPLAANEWFHHLSKQFQQASDGATMAAAEAKARLTAREQAVTQREQETETIMIALQAKMDAIRACI